MSTRLPRIWIITDPSHPDGPVAPLRTALHGCPPGLVGVQVRAKRVSDRRLAAWGRELRALTARAGCALCINQRADVAQIVQADGVHLPERGLSPSDVRAQWPELPMIGASRHDAVGLSVAAQEGASYAFLSPVFEVPEKAEPLGVGGFERAIADVEIPTYALGGITPGDVAPLFDAGAHGIAIRRAIYGASHPRETLERFLRELDKSLAGGE